MRSLRFWIVPVVFAIVAVAAVFFIPGPIVDHQQPGLTLVDRSSAIGVARQGVLFAVGGLIALVGVRLSVDRHALALKQAADERERESTRISELAVEQRTDQERELRARFVTSVQLLSDPDKPATRQAGMYALAALADDWQGFENPNERDVCIEVICGYLRSKWDPEDKLTSEAERSIRATGFNLIASHLRLDAGERSWDGATFNLRKTVIDFDVNAIGIEVASSVVDLTSATFSGGTVSFSGSTFSGGTVSFSGATFAGGTVSFGGPTFSGGTVSFDEATFLGGEVSFGRATFAGGTVSFSGATFAGGKVSFSGATFAGGTVSFGRATFSGGEVYFALAKFLGGTVYFARATFSGGSVSSDKATFSGGRVSFDGATFSGTTSESGEKFVGFSSTEHAGRESDEDEPDASEPVESDEPSP